MGTIRSHGWPKLLPFTWIEDSQILERVQEFSRSPPVLLSLRVESLQIVATTSQNAAATDGGIPLILRRLSRTVSYPGSQAGACALLAHCLGGCGQSHLIRQAACVASTPACSPELRSPRPRCHEHPARSPGQAACTGASSEFPCDPRSAEWQAGHAQSRRSAGTSGKTLWRTPRRGGALRARVRPQPGRPAARRSRSTSGRGRRAGHRSSGASLGRG